MSVEMDDYDRSLLTPEELAAIEEDVSPEEIESLKGIAGEDDDEEEDEEEDEDAPTAAAAKPVTEPVEQSPDPVAAKAEQEPEQEESAAKRENLEPFRPQYQADLPADYDDKLASLRSQSKELAKQLHEGAIGVEDYADKLEDVTSQRESLLTLRTRAEMSQDMGKQTAEQEWRYVVARFNAEVAATDGIDYTKDTAKRRDMDMFLKALATDEANENRSSEWFLAEAHKRVKIMHAVTTTQAPAAAEKPKAPTGRKPPTDKLPPSLAHVAGSDGPGDVSDEFSGLDRLDGIELESAIAKMTPAQRNRYLQAA